MSKNENLINAQKAKRDEFFTPREAVENELKYYPDCFKGKIVYCNCDDPHVSEFFKYFLANFKRLGLKALYCTCYEGSETSQLRLNQSDDEYQGKPYKAIILEDDINTIIDEYGELTRETAERYINEYDKIEILKGNGSFDSPECLKLLEKADIVVTNEPFSLTIPFINLLMEYNKKFLIIANKNAITYKEVFPLIKDNKLWLGYTQPKEFMTPTGEISKKLSGLTRWFTNLDIPKRHDDLILWKKYSPEEYPHYDNYDAINVDKVAEIPCDYCESWGLYPEEFEALDKNQWEEVRREPKDDTELIYVIPAKNTELRQALHEHAEGYKEKIEAELANVIYCNGVLGVPITYVDKANSKQFEILEGDEYRKKKRTKNSWSCTSYHDSKESNLPSYPYQKDIVTELLELQSHSSISGVQNSLELKGSTDTSMIIQDMATVSESTTEKHTHEFLSKRYCNGQIGVPITFLDKCNPNQFKLTGLGTSRELYTPIKKYLNPKKYLKDGRIVSANEINSTLAYRINKEQIKNVYYKADNIDYLLFQPYARILIQRIL